MAPVSGQRAGHPPAIRQPAVRKTAREPGAAFSAARGRSSCSYWLLVGSCQLLAKAGGAFDFPLMTRDWQLTTALVAVVVGLVRAIDRHADVAGLSLGQRRQLGVQ